MTVENALISTIYQGWHTYQETLMKAIAPLSAEQLSLRAASDLRSVREIAAHMIGARARWFNWMEGTDAFKPFVRWDSSEAKVWSAKEIVEGLEATWSAMQEAIGRWTPRDWEQTWPGDVADGDPEVITRPFVIWHLIEHDLYHGGQISTTLGTQGLPTLEL